MGCVRSRADQVANRDQENAKMEMTVLERWLKLNSAKHVNVRNGLTGQNFHPVAKLVVVVKK